MYSEELHYIGQLKVTVFQFRANQRCPHREAVWMDVYRCTGSFKHTNS